MQASAAGVFDSSRNQLPLLRSALRQSGRSTTHARASSGANTCQVSLQTPGPKGMCFLIHFFERQFSCRKRNGSYDQLLKQVSPGPHTSMAAANEWCYHLHGRPQSVCNTVDVANNVNIDAPATRLLVYVHVRSSCRQC